MSRLSYKSLILILLFLLIPIVLFLRISQKTKDTYANWWDETWMYRQSINISSHTSDETDVFITTTISLSSTDKAQTDDGDFRFLNSTGQQLPYFIVSGTGTTSITFHINLDSFPSGAQTLYAYYGNPSATNGFSTSDFTTEASNYTLGSQGTEEIGGGPIGYWKFDEGVGTSAYDSSSPNNNGSLANTSWKTEDECISGKCVDLTGSASISVNTNNTNVLNFGTDNFTISAWALHRDYTYPKSNFMIKKSATCYGAGAANAGFDIGHEYKSNGIDICLHDTSDNYTRQTLVFNNGSQPSQLIKRWVHYVLIFDRSNNKVMAYINGVKQNNELDISSITGSINTSSPLVMGTLYGWQTDGVYDEVKIYPYARSEAQIKADYAAGLAGMGSSSDSSVSFGTSSSKFLSDGLVGYWKFDEGVGNTSVDSSGNNKTASFCDTLVSTCNITGPTWQSGKFGSSPLFDGVNDGILTTSTSTTNLSHSMSAWIYLNTTPSSFKYIFGANSGVGGLVVNSNLGLSYSSSGGANGITSNNSEIPLNRWIHVAVTADYNSTSGEVKLNLYKNGVNIKSVTTTPAIFYVRWGGIGMANGDTNNYSYSWWSGSVDEARIYNRALSPTEVKQLYEFAPGPLVHYKFEEKTGSVAFDSSGNNYNSTFSVGDSAPTWTTGKIGSGLKYNRYNVSSSATITPNIVSKVITQSGWYKFDNFTSIQRFVSSNTQGYIQAGLSGNSIFIHSINSVGTDYNIGNVTLPSNCQTGWHYLTIIRDSTLASNNVKAYCDGVQFTSGSFVNGLNGTYTISSLYLGYNGSDQSFDGYLDDFKIYNYARTQQQILQDMNASPPNTTSKVADPIAYYKFDEGFGSTTANWGIGGTALNGTLASSTSSPTWTDGKLNKALSFDGGDYVTYGTTNDFNFGTNSFTFSLWAKFGATRTVVPISKNTSGYSEPGYRLYVNPDSRMEISVTDGTNSCGYFTPPINNYLNKWTHYTGVWNSDNKKCLLYADGLLLGSGTNNSLTSTSNTTRVLTIGRNAGGGYGFQGLIDEVKIYNYALSADQIKQDYNQNSSAVFGSISQTIGATTTSLEYCLPGDTSPCAPPIGEWKFDEGVGTTAYDTSGNNNNARFFSTTFWSTGKIGKSTRLNGTTDYSSVTDPASGILDFDSNSFTVSTWVKKGTLTGQRSIIQKLSGTAGVNPGWTIYQHSGNNLTFLVADGDGAGFYNTVATTPINDNNWHHITAVADKTNSKLYLYVDGALKNTSNITDYASGSVSGSDNLTFGSGWGFMDGLIDQVRIYNYARTPAQIAYDYNKGAPVAWYKMDECQGTLINDWSGNANHGTLSVGSSASPISPGTCSTADTAWGNGKTGKINSSVSFNGPDDHIKLNQILGQVFWKSRNRSISAWIKPTSASLTGNHNFITAYETQWNYTRMWFTINSGKLSFLYTIYPSVTTVTLLSQNNLTADTWYHAVVTWDENTYYLYLNGVLQSTYNNSLITTDNPRWTTIGGDIRYGNYFFGQIDDVRIYNYALTPTQIKTLYNNGAVTFR